ncbi:SPFH domain-containing protein [Luedemannella helvata]|uniref:Band 7 domain-containing protein n=1 Tax=Luedemannella helvata TaxID=349315 RepID=A0ABP4WP04_9ACTN
MSEQSNAYLDQVVARQEALEQDLRVKRSAPAPAAAMAPQRARVLGFAQQAAPPPTPSSGAVGVRVTGVGPWKTVLVPPNAFVVHTRRGHAEPLHMGLGVSFRYRPRTDSFMVVPGAMQTIVISARCICEELQGVLVQAYVQWIIEDIGTAYRKLDFSDTEDPMRLINLQLKEQAEAAIKDKVATMGVREVLSDKQPIIEELTARLRDVAEGSGDANRGLGLRIVTVQIKEAVVSSSRLWENLQGPYRADQRRVARLAELAADASVTERELAAERTRTSQRLENDRQVAELQARHEAARFDREAEEKVRRAERDRVDEQLLADLAHEGAQHALRLSRERHDAEQEFARERAGAAARLAGLELDAELARTRARAEAGHQGALLELERARVQAEIDNGQSPASVQAKLIDALPDIVARLPKPDELRSVTIGGADQTTVAGLVTELAAVVGALRSVASSGS